MREAGGRGRRRKSKKMPGQNFLKKEEAESLPGRRGRQQKLPPWPCLEVKGEAETVFNPREKF